MGGFSSKRRVHTGLRGIGEAHAANRTAAERARRTGQLHLMRMRTRYETRCPGLR
jgi:hypothetical protein